MKKSCNLINVNDFNIEDRIILIRIKKEKDINAHLWWDISKKHMDNARQVAIIRNGIIKKVYSIDNWYYNEKLKRWSFNGKEIINSPYKNKKVSNDLLEKPNPVIITFKLKNLKKLEN